MNALNVEAKLAAIASTPNTTSINAIIFPCPRKIRQRENVPGRFPLAAEDLLTSRFLLDYPGDLSPQHEWIAHIRGGTKKSMQQHIAVLGRVTRELIGWWNINLHLKRKALETDFYTMFPNSPTIVNTPNIHQGATLGNRTIKRDVYTFLTKLDKQEVFLITLCNNNILGEMLTVTPFFISNVSLRRSHL